MWFLEQFIINLSEFLPVWIVVFSNEQLQPFPTVACGLSVLDIDAHHVVNVGLFKLKIIINELSTVGPASSKDNLLQVLA
jgi:hypothetical protein